MSRIGRLPISVPAGVTVSIADGNVVTIKGAKGELTKQFSNILTIEKTDSEILVTRPNDTKEAKSLHGLTRTLINNMVTGVTTGFTKELEIEGVGYRAAKQGNNLVMNIGYSHQVIMEPKYGVTIDVPSQTKIVISGLDKQAVGQFAAEVREKRLPEPYRARVLSTQVNVLSVRKVKPVRAKSNIRSDSRWLKSRIVIKQELQDIREFVLKFQELLNVHVLMCSAPLSTSTLKLSMM